MSDADFKADPSMYTADDPAAPVTPEADRPVGGIAAGLAGAEQATFVAPPTAAGRRLAPLPQEPPGHGRAGLPRLPRAGGDLRPVDRPVRLRRAHLRRVPRRPVDGPLVRHRHDRPRRLLPGRLRRPHLPEGRLRGHDHGGGHRPRPRGHRRLRRRTHRQPHHALHRHLPGHPLHHPGHRGGHDLRPERELGDPRARVDRLAGDLPHRAGQLPGAAAAWSTWRRPGRSGSARPGSSSGTCSPTRCSRSSSTPPSASAASSWPRRPCRSSASARCSPHRPGA